jgi:hypothetical protein
MPATTTVSVDDTQKPLGLDSTHDDRGLGAPADAKGGSTHHGGDGGHAWCALDSSDDGGPLVDRTQSLGRHLHVPRDGHLSGGLGERSWRFAGQAQRNVRLRAQCLGDQRDLMPADEGREKHDHGDADGDGREDQDRLPFAVPEVTERHEPFEEH